MGISENEIRLKAEKTFFSHHSLDCVFSVELEARTQEDKGRTPTAAQGGSFTPRGHAAPTHTWHQRMAMMF